MRKKYWYLLVSDRRKLPAFMYTKAGSELNMCGKFSDYVIDPIRKHPTSFVVAVNFNYFL